ncbi:hypothetical protein [Vreelandella sp. EE27]
MAHGFADTAAQAVVAVGGIDRTAPLACAGELDQPVGTIKTERQAVTGGIEGVAVGLVAVLAAGQAARGVIAVGNNAGSLVTLHASETHATQSVVLVLLPATVLRTAQGQVIELAEVRIAALQNQGRRLVARCQGQAPLGLPVQSVRLQVDFQVQPRGAQPVQVAAAVGVPVERG